MSGVLRALQYGVMEEKSLVLGFFRWLCGMTLGATLFLGIEAFSFADKEPHIKALIKAYREAKVTAERIKQLKALGLLGKKAHIARGLLVKASQDPKWEIRREALIALGHLGPALVGPVLRSMTARSLDTHWEVRMAAAQALYQTARPPWTAKVLPWLVGLVHDAKPEVRIASIEAIGRLGKVAHHALPTLLHALRDREPQVKQEALIAIRSLGRKALVALPELKRLLKSKDYLTRTLAAQTLATWGEDAWPATTALAASLADPEMCVRLAAAQALARMKARGWPVLKKALKHRFLVVRLAAVKALQPQLPASSVVSLLNMALLDKAPAMQEAVLLALGEAGEAGKPTIPRVLPSLNSSRVELRQAAILALSRMGRAAVPALQKAALSKSWWLRVAALDALGAIGSAAAPAAPSLLLSLHHPQWQVRRAAALAIPAVGSDLVRFWPTEHTVKELIRALLDGQWRVRYAAITALRWFGPKAAAARVALRKQKAAKEVQVRLAALRALKALRGPASVKRKKSKP